MTATTESKVVDASALAALLFGEPGADEAAARLQDGRLLAPVLLEYEITNVCLNKLRREPARRTEILFGFAARTRIKIEYSAVDHDAVLALADANKLSAYDASYLWLAQVQNAELVTLDKKLAAAFVYGRQQ